MNKDNSLILVDESAVPSAMGDESLFLNGNKIASYSSVGEEIYKIKESLAQSCDCEPVEFIVDLKEFSGFLAAKNNLTDAHQKILEEHSDSDKLKDLLDEFCHGYTNSDLLDFVNKVPHKPLVIGINVEEGHHGWECVNCKYEWSSVLGDDQVPEVCPHCFPEWSALSVTVKFSQENAHIHSFQTTMDSIGLQELVDAALSSEFLVEHVKLDYTIYINTNNGSELIACNGSIHPAMFSSHFC
ncbi:hypothetical protein [Vibrio sp. D431a]|uniref:hypothetical protein n=1 Tax=Vibrio sp. D431a TaxID=2837388 RepID=UPI00255527FC|nr:hypothetical protein [Vibrio sp. D431a]MDK9793717.1 hypothetical protein [Vibrio sp. D431a]